MERTPLSGAVVIVVDRALPKHSGEYLLEVIMRRYETRSTIMTSNRPLEDWGKLLQDVPTAGAVLDRFLHHATIVNSGCAIFKWANSPFASISGADSKYRAASGMIACNGSDRVR